MLGTGYLGGKCADLKALFVGLVRAVGIPARDVDCIRVAPSMFGYKALCAKSETITRRGIARPRSFFPAVAGRRRIPPTCAKSCSAGKPGDRQPEDGGRAPDAIRYLGGQPARLQHGTRCRTAGFERTENRLPDVSASRVRKRAARFSRSGFVPLVPYEMLFYHPERDWKKDTEPFRTYTAEARLPCPSGPHGHPCRSPTSHFWTITVYHILSGSGFGNMFICRRVREMA
jgi:hypothetical protein